MWCDGTAYDGNNPAYAALWGRIGNTYGGTDITDFEVPNLNGRSPMGFGQGTTAEGGGLGSARSLGELDGAERDTLTLPELPQRDVTQYDPFSGTVTVANGVDHTVPDTTTRLFNMTGGGDLSHNNQSPVIVVGFQIKL